MKYLKEMCEYKKINNRLIEDIKDMSLEYIDSGYTLYILIGRIGDGLDKSRYVCRLKYNHEVDEFNKFNLILKNSMSESGFAYFIQLLYKDSVLIEHDTLELIERAKRAYPNEKFYRTIREKGI